MLRLLCLWLVLITPTHAKPLPLSLTFDQTPVEQVLQALADYQQLNLVVSPGVEGTLSLRLHQVPWEQALSLVLKTGDLSMEQEGNVLLIYPHSRQQEKQRAAAAQREADKLSLPLQTRHIRLKYADAGTVNSSLQSERQHLMTPRGSHTPDARTNSILLRDTAAALDQTVRWLRQLDVPLAQVELAAHIVNISEESLRELGVSWGLNSEAQLSDTLGLSQLRVNPRDNRLAGRIGFNLARMDAGLLELELSALEQENQADIIASPRLLTSHQQTASIKQGTEIPYEVASGGNGATSLEFKEAVLGMEVTPEIQADRRILLKLHITHNLPGQALRRGESELLTVNKQEIKTQVIVNDGQTLALGGIFQQQSAVASNRVPLLGDLPGIGRLFRHDRREQKRRELVIFITPRLLSD